MTEKATIRRQATADLGQDRGQLAVLWVYPDLSGRLTLLPSGRTVLGRDFGTDIRLPGEETSRQHAEIVKETALVVIRDLESTNGVFVDGRQVTSAPIDEGSVVRIGDWVGIVLRTLGDEREGPLFREILPGYFGGPQTLAAIEPVRSAAPTDLPVVIEGETGTGKEGVARAVHEWSRRAGPFVAVNCAALPEALAEGELFGYRKGAFTGADRTNAGYFQAAHKGTLFLDEVVDLPPAIQPKLLRVLEQREVTPLGEAKAVPVDVRVVVATQTPLADSVKDKRFRPDLFARLDGLHVRLPPLRSRIEEVPYLFTRLLAERASEQAVPQVDAAFVERLCCYDWPFNIRELSLLVRKLLALHGGEKVLKRSHLSELTGRRGIVAKLSPGARAAGPRDVDVPLFLDALRRSQGNVDRAAEELGIDRQQAYRLMESGDLDSGPLPLGLTEEELNERQRIVQVLDQCAGSQTEAARRLNLSRSTLIERLKKYGIPRPRARRDL
jgi:DNA-binding NtrC family response regulator